jgi:hypothetical protein
MPDHEMPTILPDDGRDDYLDPGFQKSAIRELLRRLDGWRVNLP